jgi:hypothetical protein
LMPQALLSNYHVAHFDPVLPFHPRCGSLALQSCTIFQHLFLLRADAQGVPKERQIPSARLSVWLWRKRKLEGCSLIVDLLGRGLRLESTAVWQHHGCWQSDLLQVHLPFRHCGCFQIRTQKTLTRIQAPNTAVHFDPAAVTAAVKAVETAYTADKNRVYLTGYSSMST